MQLPTLSTVSQFCKRNPAFKPGGIRHYIFYRDENGLASSGAIIKLGRKILIDEEKFFEWVRRKGSA